jgi:hypothetical protein
MFVDLSMVVVVPSNDHSPLNVILNDFFQLVMALFIGLSRSFEIDDETSLGFTHSNVGHVLVPLHVAQEGGSFLLSMGH